jgi:hypothetical protein
VNLVALLDRLMGTSPHPHATIVSPDPAQLAASSQVDRLQSELSELDSRVAVAEAILRSRPWVLPPSPNQEAKPSSP